MPGKSCIIKETKHFSIVVRSCELRVVQLESDEPGFTLFAQIRLDSNSLGRSMKLAFHMSA